MDKNRESKPDSYDLNEETIGGQWALIITPLMLIIKQIGEIKDCLEKKYEKLIKTFKQ